MRVRILGIFVASSFLRVPHSGSRDTSPESQGPSSKVLGVRGPCPRVSVPVSCVLSSQARIPEPRVPVLRVQGLRFLVLGAQVLIWDYAVLLVFRSSRLGVPCKTIIRQEYRCFIFPQENVWATNFLCWIYMSDFYCIFWEMDLASFRKIGNMQILLD